MTSSGRAQILLLAPVTRPWRLFFDRPHQVLFVHFDDELRVTLHLTSAVVLRKDIDSLSREQLQGLRKLFRRFPPVKDGPESSQWVMLLERLGFLLASLSAGQNDDVAAIRSRLFAWLIASGAGAAWLVRFDNSLGFAARYRLLARVIRARSAAPGAGRGTPAGGASGEEARQHQWLCSRLLFDLAEEWSRDRVASSPESEQAYRESRDAYLQILRSEPYRRELDEYLTHRLPKRSKMTGIEAEVARVIEATTDAAPAVKRLDRGKSDEAIDRAFLSWFLQRHALASAFRLMWRSRSTVERGAAYAASGMLVLAVLLFALQAIPRAKLGYLPSVPFPASSAWGLQSAMQILALLTLAGLSPALFSVLLPRALFGSLLTWITLIIMSMPGLWTIDLAPGQKFRLVAAQYLCTHPLLMIWFPIAVFFLLLIFVMRDVGQWTRVRLIIVRRAAATAAGLMVASTFWGMIFAYPLAQLLAWPNDPPCLKIPVIIAMLGGASSALFAVVVELIWEERSIAEPLGETL